MCQLRSFHDHWWIKRSFQNAAKNNMLIRNKNGLASHSCKGPFPLATSQALWVLTSTELDAVSSTQQAQQAPVEYFCLKDLEQTGKLNCAKCCYELDVPPQPRMTVTTRMTWNIFGFGHPNLNLHLPRASLLVALPSKPNANGWMAQNDGPEKMRVMLTTIHPPKVNTEP